MRWKIRVAQGFQTKSAILVGMAAIINYSQCSPINDKLINYIINYSNSSILKNLGNIFPQPSRIKGRTRSARFRRCRTRLPLAFLQLRTTPCPQLRATPSPQLRATPSPQLRVLGHQMQWTWVLSDRQWLELLKWRIREFWMFTLNFECWPWRLCVSN